MMMTMMTSSDLEKILLHQLLKIIILLVTLDMEDIIMEIMDTIIITSDIIILDIIIIITIIITTITIIITTITTIITIISFPRKKKNQNMSTIQLNIKKHKKTGKNSAKE